MPREPKVKRWRVSFIIEDDGKPAHMDEKEIESWAIPKDIVTGLVVNNIEIEELED